MYSRTYSMYALFYSHSFATTKREGRERKKVYALQSSSSHSQTRSFSLSKKKRKRTSSPINQNSYYIYGYEHGLPWSRHKKFSAYPTANLCRCHYYYCFFFLLIYFFFGHGREGVKSASEGEDITSTRSFEKWESSAHACVPLVHRWQCDFPSSLALKYQRDDEKAQ